LTPKKLNSSVPYAINATAAARYKKVVTDGGAIERLFVDAFVQAHAQPPAQVVLDLDATDDPVHGQQEGRLASRPRREPIVSFGGGVGQPRIDHTNPGAFCFALHDALCMRVEVMSRFEM